MTEKKAKSKKTTGKSSAAEAERSNQRLELPPAKPLTEKNTLEYPELDSILAQLDNDKNDLMLTVDGAEIKYSNLNKVLWPAVGDMPGATKRDYLIYLTKMAPAILRYIHNRPLTLIRYPNGIHGQKFFQKHWAKNLPAFMDTTTYFSEHNDKNTEYLVCNRLPGLLWLAQIADLELHVLHTRITPADDENPDLSADPTGSVEQIRNSVMNYPDFVVLDLDPYLYSGKEAKGEEPELHKKGFKKTCEVALHVKEILDHLGLNAFVKTSGRTGLHLYVPISRTINYETVRDLAKTIGQHVMKDMPDDVTMTWAVNKRAGKVFFDHNMNGRGKTLPCPYSARNAAEASVSMPVRWDELGSIYPTDFTIFTAPERVARSGDLWFDILDHKIDIKNILKKSPAI